MASTPLLELNPAESIFAPFNDGAIAPRLPLTVTPAQAAGFRREFFWDSTKVRWDDCAAGRPAGSIRLPLDPLPTRFDHYVFAIVLPVGLWLLPRVFRLAALGNREIFTLLVVFVALAMGWVSSMLGVSLALGAFVGALTGRTPAQPGAQVAASQAAARSHRAVGAAEARAEAVAVVVEGAPARDAAADRAMVAAAAEVAPVAGEPAFLSELRKRGGSL
jgi:hypothetical protein